MPKLTDNQKINRTREMRHRLRQGMIALITEVHIAAVTMDMLAERLQVAKGSIYNYYPNKTALINDALTEIDRQVLETVEALGEMPGDPAQKLKGIADFLFHHFETYRNVYAAFYDPSVPSLQHREAHREHSERMRIVFARELQHGIAAGTIRNHHHAQELSVVVYGALVGMIRLLFFAKMPYSPKQCSEMFHRIIVDELFGQAAE